MMVANGAQNRVAVLVSDPIIETDDRGRQKHTLYLVEQFGKDASSVRRRYSDFQWLYKKLMEEVPGAIIPIIPHRQALRPKIRFSDEFVDERCDQLDVFFKRVASHPELQDSMNMKVFMTSFADEWEAARRRKDDDDQLQQQQQIQEPQQPINNVGRRVQRPFGRFFRKAKARVMIAAGTKLEATPDDSTFESLESYINLMDTTLKSMAKDALATSKLTKDRGTILSNLTTSMNTMGEQRFPMTYNDNLGPLFNELGEEVGPIAHVALAYQAQEEKVWTEPMQDLSREVQAAKLALQRRKHILFDYSRKRGIHKSKKLAFEKGKATQDQVEQADQESRDAWTLFDEVSKRVKREMESFRDIFEEKLRTTVAAYATLQSEYLADMSEGWKAIVPIAIKNGGRARGSVESAPTLGLAVLSTATTEEMTEDSGDAALAKGTVGEDSANEGDPGKERDLVAEFLSDHAAPEEKVEDASVDEPVGEAAEAEAALANYAAEFESSPSPKPEEGTVDTVSASAPAEDAPGTEDGMANVAVDETPPDFDDVWDDPSSPNDILPEVVMNESEEGDENSEVVTPGPAETTSTAQGEVTDDGEMADDNVAETSPPSTDVETETDTSPDEDPAAATEDADDNVAETSTPSADVESEVDSSPAEDPAAATDVEPASESEDGDEPAPSTEAKVQSVTEDMVAEDESTASDAPSEDSGAAEDPVSEVATDDGATDIDEFEAALSDLNATNETIVASDDARESITQLEESVSTTESNDEEAKDTDETPAAASEETTLETTSQTSEEEDPNTESVGVAKQDESDVKNARTETKAVADDDDSDEEDWA